MFENCNTSSSSPRTPVVYLRLPVFPGDTVDKIEQTARELIEQYPGFKTVCTGIKVCKVRGVIDSCLTCR